MFNLFTVDVEDYPALFFRDLLGQEAPVSERVVESTRRILDLLESTNTSATFFCLGSVALRHPHLIREIRDRGGEIASHGMHHIPFHGLNLEQIREDLTSAKSVLEDILGEPVPGFRAPQFSVSLDRPEVLECIVEAGYTYDSSIFPFSGRRYGSAVSPRCPYQIKTSSGTLSEYPLATLTLFGRRFPIGGGGYLRHFPYKLNYLGLRSLNREGIMATVYLHPYECDITAVEYSRDDLTLIKRLRVSLFNIHQYHGRAGMPDKITALLTDFKFSSIASATACGLAGECVKIDFQRPAVGPLGAGE